MQVTNGDDVGDDPNPSSHPDSEDPNHTRDLSPRPDLHLIASSGRQGLSERHTGTLVCLHAGDEDSLRSDGHGPNVYYSQKHRLIRRAPH